MDHEKELREETLEFIWAEREAGRSSIAKLLEIKEIRGAGVSMKNITAMQKQGYLFIRGDDVALSDKGEVLGRLAIRRHRLAERLLTEVLAVKEHSLEDEACNFEHILSKGVTDSICTLLGHPPACPHGHPIPRGQCCLKTRMELKPLVKSLTEIKAGDRARIVFIIPSAHSRLDKLSAIGILPGATVKVHQKRPAFVLELGETTIAIDRDIAKEIFVRVVK